MPRGTLVLERSSIAGPAASSRYLALSRVVSLHCLFWLRYSEAKPSQPLTVVNLSKYSGRSLSRVGSCCPEFAIPLLAYFAVITL